MFKRFLTNPSNIFQLSHTPSATHLDQNSHEHKFRSLQIISYNSKSDWLFRQTVLAAALWTTAKKKWLVSLFQNDWLNDWGFNVVVHSVGDFKDKKRVSGEHTCDERIWPRNAILGRIEKMQQMNCSRKLYQICHFPQEMDQ